MGTSSELSLSCISLSGEWSKGTTASVNSNSSLLYVLFFCGVWGQWRRMAGNCRLIFWAAIFIFYRLSTRLQEPGAASFQALVCVCPLFAQSGSSEMIIQSSSTSLHHARHSGVSVPAFSFSQWHAHHVFLGYLRATSSQLELQKAFSPASSPNTAHTYTLAAHLPTCWLYLAARRWWQRRQNSFFFPLSAELPGKLCQLQQQRRSLHGPERVTRKRRKESARDKCVPSADTSWTGNSLSNQKRKWAKIGDSSSVEPCIQARCWQMPELYPQKRQVKGDVQFHTSHAVAVSTQDKDILLPGRVSFF